MFCLNLHNGIFSFTFNIKTRYWCCTTIGKCNAQKEYSNSSKNFYQFYWNVHLIDLSILDLQTVNFDLKIEFYRISYNLLDRHKNILESVLLELKMTRPISIMVMIRNIAGQTHFCAIHIYVQMTQNMSPYKLRLGGLLFRCNLTKYI